MRISNSVSRVRRPEADRREPNTHLLAKGEAARVHRSTAPALAITGAKARRQAQLTRGRVRPDFVAVSQGAALHFSRFLAVATITVACASAFAQPAEWWGRSTHGFRSAETAAKVAPSTSSRDLKKGPAGLEEEAAVKALEKFAKAAFKDSAARIVMVARDDRLLFEDSAWSVTRPTPLERR